VTTLDTDLQRLARQFDIALEQAINEFSANPVANLHEGLTYGLGLDLVDPAARGKRIRPLLCLLTAEALDQPPETAMPFALAIELMHNFALVHDDIQDGDTMRRNRPAIWKEYGLEHGINIGDYFLVQVFNVLSREQATDHRSARLQRDWLRLMIDTLDHTHRGQALDMNARENCDFGCDDYLEIVREKTGYYLAAPIVGGAMTAGADPALLKTLQQVGLLLGPSFQIMDDIIDLTRGKGRGAIGNDIGEGKRSFLVAWTSEKATITEKNRLFNLLDLPREKTGEEEIRAVLELFEKYNAIEAGHTKAREMHQEAMALLAENVPPMLATTLKQVADSLLQRQS
jgi:geranylgeranyl pyrophosphate synthase